MSSVDPLVKALLAEAHETADQIILKAREKVRDTLLEQEKKGGDKAKEMVEEGKAARFQGAIRRRTRPGGIAGTRAGTAGHLRAKQNHVAKNGRHAR